VDCVPNWIVCFVGRHATSPATRSHCKLWDHVTYRSGNEQLNVARLNVRHINIIATLSLAHMGSIVSSIFVFSTYSYLYLCTFLSFSVAICYIYPFSLFVFAKSNDWQVGSGQHLIALVIIHSKIVLPFRRWIKEIVVVLVREFNKLDDK